jgi:hypothetical protein
LKLFEFRSISGRVHVRDYIVYQCQLRSDFFDRSDKPEDPPQHLQVALTAASALHHPHPRKKVLSALLLIHRELQQINEYHIHVRSPKSLHNSEMTADIKPTRNRSGADSRLAKWVAAG